MKGSDVILLKPRSGDGSVLAAARVLLGRDIALGIVPLRTANLLAPVLAPNRD